MANRQRRNPGELARFEATGQISENLPSFATPGNTALFDALASVAGGLSNQLGRMADRAALREGELAGLTAGQTSAAAYLRQQQVQRDASSAIPDGPAEEQAKALLRKEEGFRDTPYWDVNAHRVGYGSDTITRADGSQVKVTRGMKITREDAERDLSYRLRSREGKAVRDQLGADWARLPANAQAALLSVGYNYGSLPSNVVKAARTGDLKQLSDSVRGLSANSQRRGREADLILSGKPVKEPSTEIAKVSTDNVPVLSTTPLALRRDGTIRGDAQDAAAIRAYGWRMQQGLSTDLANAYEQNKDDPQAFGDAVRKVRETYLQDESFADPELREIFDKAFVDKAEGYARDVASRQESRLRQEEQASFAGALDAQTVELERQAIVLGASKEGDAVTSRQLGKVIADIDKAVDDGTISPAAAVKLRANAEETAVRGRVQGVYEALDTPEKKRQFSLSILEDWKEGKGPIAKLSYDQARRMSDTLFADATEKSEKARSANRLEAARISDLIRDDLASTEATGKGVAEIDVARAEELLGPEKVAAWKADREVAAQTYSATAGMMSQSAEDLAERVAALEPKPGTPGYADQERIFAAAQKRATAILKERAADPADAAEKSFPEVAELAANANPEDPDSMAALVTGRLQAQSALGIAELAQEPLTNKEALALSRSVTLETDPAKQAERMGQLSDQVVSAYGPHADKVMAQILRARGVDRELANMGAAFFKRSQAELSTADRRTADVATDAAAADNAGKPVATDQFPMPNYRQQQMLMDRPELAGDFDRKFGPGAAQRILGARRKPSAHFPVDGGTVTINPDGSEDFTPEQPEKQ